MEIFKKITMINLKSFSLLFFLGMIVSIITQDSVKAQSNQIQIPCGKNNNISSLQVFAQCPVDADKDDIPDQSYSILKLTNLSDQDLYVTTDVFPISHGTTNFEPGSVFKTILIKSKNSASTSIDNADFDRYTKRYSYPSIKLGKLNIPILEAFSDQLSCEGIQDGRRKKFGITYYLDCSDQSAFLNIEKSHETQNRMILIKYRNKNGIDTIISMLKPVPDYHTNSRIPLGQSNNYQIQILISDPSKKVNLVSPSKPKPQSTSNSPNKMATVFAPPSNVRATPTSDGQVLCAVDTIKKIKIYGSEKEWYKTDVCGKIGYIHKSQIRF